MLVLGQINTKADRFRVTGVKSSVRLSLYDISLKFLRLSGDSEGKRKHAAAHTQVHAVRDGADHGGGAVDAVVVAEHAAAQAARHRVPLPRRNGERMMRWRRRPGVGEFRYDPLSYALNFDEGDRLGVDEDHDGSGRRRGFVCRSFSAQLKPAPRDAFEAA
ncbi:hypothetical protein U9M48_025452 [Paspalum notatum var. saurae]|uniref:Uncharacterized protein n=1 Tax=Paspalum notatum var. saurae TaxID=547442 RepID=A0AAQ3TTM3_PASNO